MDDILRRRMVAATKRTHHLSEPGTNHEFLIDLILTASDAVLREAGQRFWLCLRHDEVVRHADTDGCCVPPCGGGWGVWVPESALAGSDE